MGYNKDTSGNPISASPSWIPGHDSFKRTDNGSEQMNIDGEPSGTPAVVWNGTGAGDTGGDWSVSGTGSETAGSMHAGTNGWDTGTATKDATTLFDNGSEIDVDGTYATLEFWMNPQAFPVGSEVKLEWQDSGGSKVGSEVKVNDYVENFDLDVWQKVTISIADFNLTADVQKLQFKWAKVAGQQFYLDDIHLVPSGGAGPFIFRLAAPDANTFYHLSVLTLVIVATESGWDSDAFGNVAGGIANGLVLRQRNIDTSEVLWSFVVKDNLGLYGLYDPQDKVTFADSQLMVGFMFEPGLESVIISDKMVLEFVVQDDLTDISAMRAYAIYGVEAAE